MDRSFGAKALIGIAIVASVLFAAPTIGRFTPSHMIVQEVYCGSCHPEQVAELNATTHLQHFASSINTTVVGMGGQPVSAAMAVTDGCTMCHNFWDNMKWFGVTNLTITQNQVDNPAPITDIYGNTVSPYGTSSTRGYQVNITGVVPWGQGLDSYSYTDSRGNNVKRVDYMWSALSAISPGPAAFYNVSSSSPFSCGTAEKGMCHVAQTAVAISESDKRPEMLNATPRQYGAGVFFRHEMAYTTAQYAAKPVKLCGACHVFKLPPMTWGGEPWSQGVIEAAAANNGIAPLAANGVNNNPNDPFGFTPNYDMVGAGGLGVITSHGTAYQFNVAYKTPDWAHQNVPCMRCHVHAGINGATVSDNTP